MAKKILITVLGLLLLLGGIGAIKGAQISSLLAAKERSVAAPETVTAAPAEQAVWQDMLPAVGSVIAIQGITVTSESPGVVREIGFESGDAVKQGALLVRLDTSVEAAQLSAAQAQRSLASLNLDRAERLHDAGIAAEAELDTAKAQAKQTRAQVGNLGAVLQRKVVRAPFAGRLGIRQVDLGQYVSPGTPIVLLQDLSSVYVDFRLPQQRIGVLSQPGLKVQVSSDAFQDKKWDGKIAAVEAAVDSATRNVRVRAQLDNPEELLKPGMFVNIQLILPTKKDVIITPATSVQYAPYGDSVFVLEDEKPAEGAEAPAQPAAAPGGPPTKVARQVFVRVGERKGDLVSLVSGVKAGDLIVTSGGFKLRTGSKVIVDNKLAPDAKSAPQVQDK